MSVTIQPLFEPVQLAAAATNYFVAGSPTRIDKMTVANPDSANSYTVTIYWVPQSGAAGVANAIVTTRRLQPLETWDVYPMIGQVLNVGDAISALASTAAKVNFFASGTVFSG